MTYIVWYNTKYRRQFEAVVSQRVWQSYKGKFGAAGAAAILVSRLHRIKSGRKTTVNSERAASHFVLGSLIRPDIFGAPIIKVGKDKKAILDRGRSELVVISTRRGISYAEKRRRRRRL
jgi:hypothetical protein